MSQASTHTHTQIYIYRERDAYRITRIQVQENRKATRTKTHTKKTIKNKQKNEQKNLRKIKPTRIKNNRQIKKDK